MELFQNTLQTGGIRKRLLCVLVWKENILETKLFENDNAGHDYHGIHLLEFSSTNTNPKSMTGDCCV